MPLFRIIIVFFVLINLGYNISAQSYRTSKDLNGFLISKLKSGIHEIDKAKMEYESGNKLEALEEIVRYFDRKINDRYFFKWGKFEKLFSEYSNQFPLKIEEHVRRAKEMMELYPSISDWDLPMKDNSGQQLSAYEFRHLSRQHKAVDVAFSIFIDSSTAKQKFDYLIDLVKSLEDSYLNKSYENKGNGVFEYYRAGNRVFNWLMIYNLLQNSSLFNIDNKILFIRTFYYHAVELGKATRKFSYGNHHTKGIMALALISILFPEFEESEIWFSQATNLLLEHLEKEINSDGFQFERSVHYHIGDIDNYFYVYYLCKINKIELPGKFYTRIHDLFSALTKIAYPNKTLPVLQDDTDNPWSFYNRMKSTMAVGSVLFNSSKFKYFAADEFSSDRFWQLREEDKALLNKIDEIQPEFLSTSLPETGYFTMRNGWEKDNIVVTLTAGLSKEKPDHQHGDMLGLQLYAYENYMLPNYQVRYYLDDYKYFKNSFVKNLCIVDSIPQGRNWKPNSGGSGFGKFLDLPKPEVLKYYTSEIVDVFIGTINYEDAEYLRKVIFIKDGIVIVRDVLLSDQQRNYQQIWQGSFSKENPKMFRKVFANGSGLDLIQLNNFTGVSNSPIVRGQTSIVFENKNLNETEFLSLLVPFKDFDSRIDERYNLFENEIKGWKINNGKFENSGISIEAEFIFSKEGKIIILDLSKINNWQNLQNKIDCSINTITGEIIFFSKEKVILQNKIEKRFEPFKKILILELK